MPVNKSSVGSKVGGKTRRKAQKNGLRLTPEIVERIREVLPKVLYLETAAALIGVSRQTMRRWFNRGRKEQIRLAGGKSKPKAAEQIYLDFAIAYQRGQAEAESQASQAIQREAADGQWRAAAWLLERRAPERWSDKRREKQEGRRDDQAESDGKRFAARLLGDPIAAELAGRLFERLVLGEGDAGGAGPAGESRIVESGPASHAFDESLA
ncbi:MAG TPA: hypothetical protein VGE52_01570 [Pirellulales bacterium]